MNLFNGMSAEKYRKMMIEQQKGSGVGIQNRKKTIPQIKTRKLKAHEISRRIFPLEFATPFHPYDPYSDEYDMNHRFVFVGKSATTQYLQYREFMLYDANRPADPEIEGDEPGSLLKQFCERSGLSPEVIMNAPQGVITDAEFRAIKGWRTIKANSKVIFSTAFSDRKDKRFKPAHLAPCVLDEEGRVDEDQDPGLFWTLYKVETQCLAREVAALEAEFEEGGNLAHLSDTNKKDMVKQVWAKRLISRPYWRYCVRYLHIPVDQTGTPSDEMMTAFNNNDFITMDAIKLCSLEFPESLSDNYIGGKRDCFFDFLELEFKVGKVDENNKLEAARKVQPAAVNKDESIAVEDSDPDSNRKHMNNFEVKYREYLDDDNLWSEKVLNASVPSFRALDETVLMNKFTHDIGAYSAMLSDPEVRAAFLTAKIDISNMVSDEVSAPIAVSKEQMEDLQDIAALQEESDPDSVDSTSEFNAIMNQIAANKASAASMEPSSSALEDDFSALLNLH